MNWRKRLGAAFIAIGVFLGSPAAIPLATAVAVTEAAVVTGIVLDYVVTVEPSKASGYTEFYVGGASPTEAGWGACSDSNNGTAITTPWCSPNPHMAALAAAKPWILDAEQGTTFPLSSFNTTAGGWGFTTGGLQGQRSVIQCDGWLSGPLAPRLCVLPATYNSVNNQTAAGIALFPGANHLTIEGFDISSEYDSAIASCWNGSGSCAGTTEPLDIVVQYNNLHDSLRACLSISYGDDILIQFNTIGNCMHVAALGAHYRSYTSDSCVDLFQPFGQDPDGYTVVRYNVISNCWAFNPDDAATGGWRFVMSDVGTPTAGETWQVTVEDTALPGSALAFSYVVQAGDAFNNVNGGLKTAFSTAFAAQPNFWTNPLQTSSTPSYVLFAMPSTDTIQVVAKCTGTCTDALYISSMNGSNAPYNDANGGSGCSAGGGTVTQGSASYSAGTCHGYQSNSFSNQQITDDNCILVPDSPLALTNPSPGGSPYGRGVYSRVWIDVYGNLVTNCGGRGIESFEAANVNIHGNTVYNAGMDPYETSGLAGIQLEFGFNNKMYDNISQMIYATGGINGTPIYACNEVGPPYKSASSLPSGDEADYNVCNNSANSSYGTNSSGLSAGFSWGAHVVTTNPLLAAPPAYNAALPTTGNWSGWINGYAIGSTASPAWQSALPFYVPTYNGAYTNVLGGLRIPSGGIGPLNIGAL